MSTVERSPQLAMGTVGVAAPGPLDCGARSQGYHERKALGGGAGNTFFFPAPGEIDKRGSENI